MKRLRGILLKDMSGSNPCPNNIQNHQNSLTHWLVFRVDRQGEISVFDPLLGHLRTNLLPTGTNIPSKESVKMIQRTNPASTFCE